MSAKSENGYMLIFRGTDWHQGLTPEETQQVGERWMAWFNRLKSEGTVLSGNPLEGESRVVSGKHRVVSDGPFAEAKEAIGGYFLCKVDTMEEAVAIAQECPGLPYGIRVEVRPVAEACPLVEKAGLAEQMAHA